MDSLQLAPPVNPNMTQPFYIRKMLPKRNENMLTQRPVLKYSTQVYLRAKPRNNPNIQQLVFRLKKTNSYTKFKIGKGVQEGSILSSCLFNLCTEYIMRNARLDEAQAGIKIARRNINNLRYADDITLLAESKEELKSLLMKVKEESEKAG